MTGRIPGALDALLHHDVVVRLRAAGCVFAEDEADLLVEAASGRALEALVARRVAGEPLEHVLGWVAFGGERVRVGPGVFVPRRRTEAMADEATRVGLACAHARVTVVEVCCGAAAVGTVVAHRLRAAGRAVRLHVADVDAVAVSWARRNVGADGVATVGDLYDALDPDLHGRVDLLLANAPYVPTAEVAHMPPEARDHEPRVALDGGADGLDVQRRVVAGARAWLAPGGSLLIESSERQAPVTAALMTAAGLDARVVHDDEVDGTVVVGSGAA